MHRLRSEELGFRQALEPKDRQFTSPMAERFDRGDGLLELEALIKEVENLISRLRTQSDTENFESPA
jgi:hypothetical protein